MPGVLSLVRPTGIQLMDFVCSSSSVLVKMYCLDFSSHLISPYLTSPHLTSPHLPHLTSPHLTSPHLTSPHLTSYLILSYLILSYLILSYLIFDAGASVVVLLSLALTSALLLVFCVWLDSRWTGPLLSTHQVYKRVEWGEKWEKFYCSWLVQPL